MEPGLGPNVVCDLGRWRQECVTKTSTNQDQASRLEGQIRILMRLMEVSDPSSNKLRSEVRGL